MVKHYDVYGRDSFIYFPVSRLDVGTKRELRKFGAEAVKSNAFLMRSHMQYRTMLMNELGPRAYRDATKSYDILGNIAIVDGDGREARKIAKAVMAMNKNVRTVVRKDGAVSGIYRTRRYRYVAGEKTYTATLRENGVVMSFDIRRSFFSNRLAFERARVSGLVRKGEVVMVMFAGIGPFALVIGKAHPDSKLIAIELNKAAYECMLGNIKLNRLKNVKAELGDVRRMAKKYRHVADRIIMPLPKDSYNFLDAALAASKRHCVFHYYAFDSASEPYKEHIERITRFFEGNGRKVRFIDMRIVRPYSAREVEIVLDFAT